RFPPSHVSRSALAPRRNSTNRQQKVPRTYHNGVKGTFMDKSMHDRLFKNIDYNKDTSFSWTTPPTTS
ncbi:unnamed protein product, partial [Hapterophycus canaliculatus]